MPDGTPEKCCENVKQFLGNEFNLHSANHKQSANPACKFKEKMDSNFPRWEGILERANAFTERNSNCNQTSNLLLIRQHR